MCRCICIELTDPTPDPGKLASLCVTVTDPTADLEKIARQVQRHLRLRGWATTDIDDRRHQRRFG